MCHPAAPIEMKRRSMLVHSVRRVPSPNASSSHRISKPPQLYSSTLGASARVTVVSVTCGVGAPTVVSFTVAPTVPRLLSASKGAHSRRCAGSVNACQTCSGEWRSSLVIMSVHRGFHETGIAQHSQVLRHGRLRHTKLALNLSNRLL